MNDDKNLLFNISSATNLAINSLDAIAPEVKNSKMKKEMDSQLEIYKNFANKAGFFRKGLLADNLVKMNVKVRAKMNPSDSHLASMIMKNREMGLISVQKALNNSPNADIQTLSLAREVMRFEENTIDSYRPYL